MILFVYNLLNQDASSCPTLVPVSGIIRIMQNADLYDYGSKTQNIFYDYLLH